jgi:hypothetical protein
VSGYPPLEENERLFEIYERSLPLYEEVLAHEFDPYPTENRHGTHGASERERFDRPGFSS